MFNYNKKNSKKMNLKTYVDELAKNGKKKIEFQREVMIKCGVSLNTVRGWCMLDSKTNDDKKLQILSEMTGISVENLFKR